MPMLRTGSSPETKLHYVRIQCNRHFIFLFVVQTQSLYVETVKIWPLIFKEHFDNGRKTCFYRSLYEAVYVSNSDTNPMLVSNMFQSIKREYLANAVKIHVTFHRKTNFNKDNFICIL